ncbi:DNA ligase D [Edaphobacter modestus]|uniref:DNA ligase (ATP) n=1 Tax=Edaphobacter modestus TaxID=388466 RepID=A0A4Q7YZU8_9BACT|nr:DNA ligase D [Edaphobacter modestus]RZU43467.1 ATP-dependent DNA ligase LigD phosphoesterase module /ATP-dependent DNA ligase LigD polymerase module [Edaphobacter modestus]
MAGSKEAAAKKSTKAEQKKTATKKPKASANGDSAANAVDEQLARYRSMRDFNITEEPSGGDEKKGTSKGLPFCVQKHAASHLHYDFRLGWNGVLKSWAVAKGPSYFTGDKRLAVQVEDHPMEYGGFEGIIPHGQYGGGTVMLWDQGMWEPQAGHTDIDAGLRDGSLKFLLHGTKLKGKWALIRMGGKWAKEKKPNWLLIKEHDEFERRQDEEPITESEADSAVTGRSIEEIARNEDHVWNSKDTRSGSKAWFRKESRDAKAEAPAAKTVPAKLLERIDELPEEQQPGFIPPQLALMAETPPSEDGWLHELKLDGYRMQARKDGTKVQMLTRTGLDWTARVKSVASEIAKLAVEKVTLDGEVVVVAPNGTTNFADLQASMQQGAKNALTYFAFDLLHLEGKNTRNLPLKQRKEVLGALLQGVDEDRLRLGEHIETGGAALLREACKLQAEGIVSKRASGKYVSGRSGDWLKMKCLHEQEFVVGGYTLPTNKIHGVGALLLGYYLDGKLIYAGRTGTGFTQKTHRILRDRLESLARDSSPFESLPGDARKGARWVKPEMVVQVRFATWTADHLVRQAAFLGIREDKAAKEVTREEPDVSLGPRRSRPKAATHRSDAGESSVSRRSNESIEHAPVRLTHPQKVLDDSSAITKQMLADYYWAVAEWMLPHIADRPVSLVRCPEGAGKPCFFQKHVNSMLPKGIGSVDIADKNGKVEPYITLNSAEALAGLAQMGVLEVHPWGSRNEHLEQPDRLVFDLDPDEELKWIEVAEAASEVRVRLKKLGLESFVKTTGGKGLHIVAPVKADHAWPEVKEFSRQFVVAMEKADPQRYLTKMTKAARKGKIYLDYLRNERGATSVAPYSPRAREGVAVSMPLSWAELKKMNERPLFQVANFSEWRERLKKDPWKDMETVNQKLNL